MRNKRSKRGQMRVIEVILALFIIVFALSFANVFSVTPSSPKYQYTELEKLGYNVLHDLDQQGLLPRFVYDSEWSNITAALRVSFPINVYFNLTVYRVEKIGAADSFEYQYNSLNDKSADGEIFYGEPAAFSSSADVASVTYSMVGPVNRSATNYDPRVLILSLTRG
jgi:hypothetical protein